MPKRFVRLAGSFFIFSYLAFFVAPLAYAQSLASPNYHFEESTIGAGGLLNSSSANYKAKSSVGDVGVGNSASPTFQVNAGSQTANDPRLSVAVSGSAVTFSDFSATTPAMATATFQVLNYTSYGYNVFITGDPPTNPSVGNHVITPMATQGVSNPGTEQFGMNLVANFADPPTVPASIGANPVQESNLVGFAFGDAGNVNNPSDPNYKTPNEFRYNNGDLIASAKKSGGYTNYTITYLINVEHLTPGGKYISNQSLVVVGTY